MSRKFQSVEQERKQTNKQSPPPRTSPTSASVYKWITCNLISHAQSTQKLHFVCVSLHVARMSRHAAGPECCCQSFRTGRSAAAAAAVAGVLSDPRQFPEGLASYSTP